MKTYAALISLVLMVLTFSSCSSPETPNFNDTRTDSYQTEETSIVKQLNQYNDSLKSVWADSKEINSSKSKWLHIMGIASADGVGAIIYGREGYKLGRLFGPKGAIIGASVSGLLGAVAHSYQFHQTTRSESYITWQQVGNSYLILKSELLVNDNLKPHHPNLQAPARYDHIINVGEKHNRMLDIIKDDKRIDAGIEMTEIEDAVLNNQDLSDRWTSYAIGAYNTTDYFSVLSNTTMGEVAHAYFTIIGQCNDSQTFYNITNYYIAKVDQTSDLSQDEKDILVMTFSLTMSSSSYWYKEVGGGIVIS